MLIRLLLLLAATVAAAPAAAQLLLGQPELLEPEKAFRISARALDEQSVEVEFKIADGYYMYRDRFSFATGAGKPLAEVEIPRGKLKKDEFFGKTETFRDLVRMRVPVSAEDTANGSLHLKVTSQGCSDKGVCYTPLEQTVRVSLPAAGGAQKQPSALMRFQVPWLLLAASLAGGLTLGWASAGAPLGRDTTRRIALPAVAVGALTLALAGALSGWAGSALDGRTGNPWIAAPLALVYLAMAAVWFRWSMHAGEFNRPIRAARDVSLFAALLLFSAYAGSIALGASATLGAALASGLFPKARTEARHEAALQAVALAMLAAAVWVSAPVLPDLFRMLAWAAWLIVAGTLLRTTDALPDNTSWVPRLLKAGGVAAIVSGIAVLIGALSGTALADEAAVRRMVEEKLRTGGQIESVRKAPFADLYEVAVRAPDGMLIYYVDSGATVIIAGQAIDARSGRNLTEERQRELTRVKWASLPLQWAITSERGTGRRKIAILSDPNCPYCKRFEEDLAKLDDITVHILPWAVVKPESVRQAKAVWCSKDRVKAWNELMFRRIEPQAPADCDNPIDELIAFGKRLGANSTPTWFLETGERYSGAMPLDEVRKLLDEASPAKR